MNRLLLSNPHQTKQTPIEMLLARMKQEQTQEKQEEVKEKIDKQYEMFRQSNRELMLKRLHNNKVSSDLSNVSGKTQPVSQIENQVVTNPISPDVSSDKQTGLKKYGQFMLKQEKINQLEKLKRTNPTLYYMELKKMASKSNEKPEKKPSPQLKKYLDLQKEMGKMSNPFLPLVSKADQNRIATF
jgi:hypothetical protein